MYHSPLKSEPQTPPRAPDKQFRQMQCQLNSIRATSLIYFWGWGRGFLFHRWLMRWRLRNNHKQNPPLQMGGFELGWGGALPLLYIYIYIYIYTHSIYIYIYIYI